MSTSLALRTTIRGIQMKFPSVKNVKTATLQSWIDEGTVTTATATATDPVTPATTTATATDTTATDTTVTDTTATTATDTTATDTTATDTTATDTTATYTTATATTATDTDAVTTATDPVTTATDPVITATDPVITADSMTSKLIIIDARPQQEYIVSHIAKSINVNFEMEDMDRVKKLLVQEAGCESPGLVNANVVLYCSVGYRSAVLADKLEKATKSDPAYRGWQFFNLEGSLFKWANEKRLIVDQWEQLTNYIHPFNGLWGKFIDKERWKWTP